MENQAIVVLTDEESKKVEEEWSNALKEHTEKLTQAFQKYSPDDYCGYIKFKEKNWGPAFNKDHDIIYNRWIAISDRWSLRYNRLHEIFTAWANLNNASIYMECYLRYGRKEDLIHLEEKLETVWAALPATQKTPVIKQYPTIPSPFPWKYT